MKKVVTCIPTIAKPYQVTLDSLAASVPLLQAAGWDDSTVSEVGCPYISHARATMLRKALDAGADVIVFIDHDVSWKPEDLLKLIETEGDVVAGTYRFKKPDVEYMGALITADDGKPMGRKDGALLAHSIPAGFLKITKECVELLMTAYPELVYGKKYNPCIDLFNHGAHEGVWYGADYAFARRWRDCGGQVWIVPDLDLDHWSGSECFKGNYHQFLMRQPGGCMEGKT
jgi:glycosyltransferase involved in cell wall biosynthesis